MATLELASSYCLLTATDRPPRKLPSAVYIRARTSALPLYSCYGHRGQQVEVPISGTRAKRILHGAINIHSGDVLLLITHEWVQETHQASFSRLLDLTMMVACVGRERTKAELRQLSAAYSFRLTCVVPTAGEV